jgi:hypothetical protein
MTPAAFAQTDSVRDAFTATRRDEGAIRVVRNARRSILNPTGDAQAPLFHAWRP